MSLEKGKPVMLLLLIQVYRVMQKMFHYLKYRISSKKMVGKIYVELNKKVKAFSVIQIRTEDLIQV